MSIDSGRQPCVGVVGGGFSGVLTAIHLLANDPTVTVRLVERAARFGAGRAYSATNAGHVLNVRASNMSAFTDRPAHFVDWLGARGEPAGPDAFVSRGLYGEYLQSLLREAVGEARHAGRLLLEQDEAEGVVCGEAGFTLRMAMGRTIPLDALVLAVGLGPPPRPPGGTAELVGSAAYVGDPWSVDPDSLPAGDILLIGTGLTMVDAALLLARPDRRLLAVSRRGLLPNVHAPTAPAQLPDGGLETPKAALQGLRTLAADAGWRSAVDGVRPVTPAIWQAWGLEERRRFLRHARPWWEVHRHRMAPAVAAQIEALLNSGGLAVAAARIETLAPDGHGVAAQLRPRGSTAVETRRFAAVVNCTGLSGEMASSPLLADLMRQGRLRHDPLRLGADVDDAFRVRGEAGAPVRGLYAVGPLARWARWETVAVPDLRGQTAEAARTVLDDLRP